MNKIALLVSQLTVNYDKTPVLWDISLSIPQGKLVGIIGPNGAGKSTLLKALLGLVKPLSGRIEYYGAPFSAMQQRIAYVPQKDSIDWDFPITVEELVLMGRYGRLGLFRHPRDADRAASLQALDLVGMRELKGRQINQLSGGQKQRIFLARALCQDADILFLDEPFSGIDINSENLILKLLKELAHKGKTLFVVHHDLPDIEEHFDWVIMLNMRLVAVGPVLEAYNPDTLSSTYGKSFHLLHDVMQLSKKAKEGYGKHTT